MIKNNKERVGGMKAIIVPPSNGGEGIYTLVAEDGEALCSHFCSSEIYAESDLYGRRPERKEMFDKKGITEFVWLKESGFTRDELYKLNQKLTPTKSSTKLGADNDQQ